MKKEEGTKNRLGKLAEEEFQPSGFEKGEINPEMIQYSEDSIDDGFSDSESRSESEKAISPRKFEPKTSFSDSDYEPSVEKKKKRKRIKKMRDDKKNKKHKKKIARAEKMKPQEIAPMQPLFERNEATISAAKHHSDLNKICAKRDFLARMSNHPHFDSTIEGCLVKVNYRNSYRIGIIGKVETLPECTYNLAGKPQNKHLDVYFDKKEPNVRVRIANVSNRTIDESEAFTLLIELADYPKLELDLSWIKRKKEDLMAMLNFKLTVKEIDQMNEDKLKSTNKTNLGLFERIQLLEKRLSSLEHMNLDLFSGKRLTKIKEIKKQITDLKKLKKQENLEKQRREGKKNSFNSFMKYEQLGKERRKFFLRTRSKPVNLWALKEEDVAALELEEKDQNIKEEKKEIKKEKIRKQSNENILQIYKKYEDSMKRFKQKFSETETFNKYVDSWPSLDYEIPNL